MYFVLIPAVVLLVLLLLPIRIVAEKKNNFDFYIKILFFKIRFPQKASKKKSGGGKSDKLAIIKKILSFSDDIKAIVEFSSKRCITVEQLAVTVRFGTGDAAQTGILTGIINAFVYSVYGIIHHHTTLKSQKAEIEPDFYNELLEISILCIARTRLLHIIRIGLKAMKLYKSYKQR